jgi:hypothetical protein
MTIFPRRHPGRPLSVLGACVLLALGDFSAGAYLLGLLTGRLTRPGRHAPPPNNTARP